MMAHKENLSQEELQQYSEAIKNSTITELPLRENLDGNSYTLKSERSYDVYTRVDNNRITNEFVYRKDGKDPYKIDQTKPISSDTALDGNEIVRYGYISITIDSSGKITRINCFSGPNYLTYDVTNGTAYREVQESQATTLIKIPLQEKDALRILHSIGFNPNSIIFKADGRIEDLAPNFSNNPSLA